MNWRKFLKISLVAVVGFCSVAAVTKDHDKLFEISKNIEIFTNLYQEINTHYVDDLNPSKMMRIGIDAMLGALDPYTNYISESEIEGYRYITEGKYKGIGADFIKIGDEVTVSAPLENSPASKAGLKAGDVLIAVDGKEVAGKRSSDVSRFLKGFPGTEVELTIKRPGTSEKQKLVLTRDEVRVENVPYSGMLNEEVGYLALTTFTRNAGRNVADAVKKLKENNPKMKGVVFDLRGNGGGLLAEAVNVSNVFVNKGELVVTTKGKVIDWDRSYKTLNRPVDTDMPLVVLIDKGSASASEIVSGVIQDLDRGVLVGQRSFGKGLVQNTQDVGYNSKVKMTIAKYYIPSGRCIQGVEYADGTPVNIPDSLRTPFKTRNGRKVLDGGGVKPDLYLDKTESERILNSLNRKHLIFDYVTQYCLANETIADVKDFRFTEFDAFVDYLEKKNFAYDTESEKILGQLKEKASSEKYDDLLKGEFTTIEQKIREAKKNDLYEFKDEIINQIEKEIAARYYYEKGKIQIGLRNDSEVKEAIALIDDTKKYNQLLKK
ncbi:MAG: S41 family peptidase [Bacteroidota bacterium]